MVNLKELEGWFVTGSQHLYGDAALKEVAKHSQEMAQWMTQSAKLSVKVVFKPALIDSLTLSPTVDGQRTATVTLHSRGPVDVDMPVYTLRGYILHWAVTSPDGSTKFSEGDVSLPTLIPASQWSGEILLTVPAADYIVTVNINRPTGFSVTDASFDAQGEQIP
ncbi:MAG: hypothetical protein IMZ73_14380 [Chloroflexi bacterium]|nr:hypothetical protein [Chloroflexota bacterium]